MSNVRMTHVGGPAALIEGGGWRLLTDPTFDPPGKRYAFGWGTSSRKLTGPAATLAEAKAAGAVTLNYGLFINVVINFFLIAFAVFMLVKFVNRLRTQLAGEKDAAAPPPPEEVQLLREIRDELKRTRA